MEAVWCMDYDYITDKCYNRPGCPECEVPIGKFDDDKYHCFSCGKEIEVKDENIIRWFEERENSKIEFEDCSSCHGKKCVETHYIKNKVTLEWQTAWGKCGNCGMQFIV